MGVIQRFAISSMVLGTLAMLGGASALAFDQDSAATPGSSAPEQSDSLVSDVPSDVPADLVSDVLPETGGPDAARGWIAPSGR